MQDVRDLLHEHVVILKKLHRESQHLTRYYFMRGLACGFLYDSGEMLRSHAQFPGIERHLPVLKEILPYKLHEAGNEVVPFLDSMKRTGGALVIFVQDYIAEIEGKCLEIHLDKLLSVPVPHIKDGTLDKAGLGKQDISFILPQMHHRFGENFQDIILDVWNHPLQRVHYEFSCRHHTNDAYLGIRHCKTHSCPFQDIHKVIFPDNCMFSVDFHVKGAVRDHQEKPAAYNIVSCEPCNAVIAKKNKTFVQTA